MNSTKSFIRFQFLFLLCAITLIHCYPRYPPTEYMDLYLDEEKQQSPQLIPLVPLINPNQYMVASVPAQRQPEQKFFILPYKQQQKKSSAEEDDHDHDHDHEQDAEPDDSEQDSEPSLKEFMPNDRPHKRTRTRCTKKVLFGDDPKSDRSRRSEPVHRSPSWKEMSDSPARSPPKHYDVHVGEPLGKKRVRKFRKGYKIDFVENTEGDVDDSHLDHQNY